MKQCRFSVASSLLLCGEYIITEDWGAGICLGIEPRAELTLSIEKTKSLTPSLQIVSSFEGRSIAFSTPRELSFWALAEDLAPPIYASAAPIAPCTRYLPQELIEEFRRKSEHRNYSVKMHIDTSKLYDSQSKEKTGLGSSACCALLCCAAHVLLSGYDPVSQKELLRRFSHELHYHWQNKKGSGYEIYASLYGACIFLERANNAAEFSWQQLPFPAEPGWVHWNGEKTVSSRRAIDSYLNWKAERPEQHRNLTRKLLSTVRQYHSCKQFPEYQNWINALRRIGTELGNCIQQCAEIAPPIPLAAWKACGAGNEQGIGIVTEQGMDFTQELPPQVHALRLTEGLRQDA